MRKDSGFSLIELLIVVAIILIIAAIAIPNLMRSRISANEASAASSLRTITSAQVTYRIFHPDYAPDLTTLGPANANLLTETLGTAPFIRNGYQFVTVGTDTAFNASAVPVQPGRTGIRSFCTDTPAVIYYSPTESGCDPASSLVL